MSANVRLFFLDQMKLPGLTVTSLLLILASCSKDEEWTISFPHQRFSVARDQSVIIPCSFTHPPAQHTDKVQVYWKQLGKEKIVIDDNDKNAFIYHHNETFVLEKFRGRTKLLGNPAKGNCTLMIQRVTEPIKNIYVRVIGNSDQYSFQMKLVSIDLAGVPGASSETPPTFIDEVFEISTMEPTTQNKSSSSSFSSSSSTYMAIFVPVTALVVIIFVAGVVFCIRRKRAKSCIREDSGYYVNVSRTPSNQAQRDASGSKQDNKKQSEPKVIDEPVYINMQVPQHEMDQRLDHTDSVYANIDYTK
ncbi:uncharacterized protein V6R79_014777 [Siganus canaliculatus]